VVSSQSTTALSTASATYTALAGAVSVAVTTTAANQKVLVSLTVRCTNGTTDSGCYMGFTASGGLTQAASDNFAVGSNSVASSTTTGIFVGAASYLLTIPTAGTTTFTAQFRRGAGGTAGFQMHEITVQVFG
jgi:hypothetical protein